MKPPTTAVVGLSARRNEYRMALLYCRVVGSTRMNTCHSPSRSGVIWKVSVAVLPFSLVVRFTRFPPGWMTHDSASFAPSMS